MYIENLFADDMRPQLENNNLNLSGPPIQINEIKQAISESKNYKAAGPDKILVEILKLIDVENILLLQTIFNKVYDFGCFPEKRLHVHPALQEHEHQ